MLLHGSFFRLKEFLKEGFFEMPKIWGSSNDAKRLKKEHGRMENEKGGLDCLNHNILVEGRPLLNFKKNAESSIRMMPRFWFLFYHQQCGKYIFYVSWQCGEDFFVKH